MKKPAQPSTPPVQQYVSFDQPSAQDTLVISALLYQNLAEDSEEE